MSQARQDDMPALLGETPAEEMARIVEALHRAHHLASALTDQDALLERLLEEARHVARAEASSLLLYEPDKEELYFHVALGESGDQEALKDAVRLKLGQGIAGEAAATRKSIVVHDAAADPRVYRGADLASNFETRNLLAVPLVERDALIGVIEVVNRCDGERFTELDRGVLEMFAGLAASSIVNARLIDEQIRNERLAAIGLAMTHLSHYTKNILTGLSSSTDLIEMGLQGNNLDVLRRCFPVFKRSVRKISNFVQDMLSFSKARTPVREWVTIKSLVDEAVETLMDLLAQREVDLRIDLGGVTEPVSVDPQAIYRCLLNILGNAAHALPSSQGRIEIRARAEADRGVRIEISDNGPGVPERFRERIFDPFFSTKGSGGTGLGLAVTRKIVEEHGGAVVCLEAPGGGALFRITLPPGPAPGAGRQSDPFADD